MIQTRTKVIAALAITLLAVSIPLSLSQFNTVVAANPPNWTLQWVMRPTQTSIINIHTPPTDEKVIVAVSDEFKVYILDPDDGSYMLQSSQFTPIHEGKLSSTIFSSSSKSGKYVAWLAKPSTLNVYVRDYAGQVVSIPLSYTADARPIMIQVSHDGKYIYIGDYYGYIAQYKRSTGSGDND